MFSAVSKPLFANEYYIVLILQKESASVTYFRTALTSEIPNSREPRTAALRAARTPSPGRPTAGAPTPCESQNEVAEAANREELTGFLTNIKRLLTASCQLPDSSLRSPFQLSSWSLSLGMLLYSFVLCSSARLASNVHFPRENVSLFQRDWRRRIRVERMQDQLGRARRDVGFRRLRMDESESPLLDRLSKRHAHCAIFQQMFLAALSPMPIRGIH